MKQILPIEITEQSENFIDYFNAANPDVLQDDIKGLMLNKTDKKVFVQVVIEKEIFLNKFTYLTEYISLDNVTTDCDDEDNPEGLMFIPKKAMQTLIDDFVNLDDDCLVEIFEAHHFKESFIANHFNLIKL